MSAELKVVKLPVSNLQDIPGMLWKTADGIEAGKWGEVAAGILILRNEDGAVEFGFGQDGNRYEIVGLLHKAITDLLP